MTNNLQELAVSVADLHVASSEDVLTQRLMQRPDIIVQLATDVVTDLCANVTLLTTWKRKRSTYSDTTPCPFPKSNSPSNYSGTSRLRSLSTNNNPLQMLLKSLVPYATPEEHGVPSFISAKQEEMKGAPTQTLIAEMLQGATAKPYRRGRWATCSVS